MTDKRHLLNAVGLSRRHFLQLSGLVGAGAASGILWGCAPAPAPGAAPSADEDAAPMPDGPVGELVIIQGVDAESLDPHVTTSGASKGMMWAMYDKLLERAPDMALMPALATEWSVVDETTWEFKLREGVNFHNGENIRRRTCPRHDSALQRSGVGECLLRPIGAGLLRWKSLTT